jgi:hypothetical protein
LFSPGDRFPLGPPHWHWEGCEDEPSGPTTRPFSLRGVVPGPRMDVEVDWPLDLPITSALADLLESGARS